MEYKLKKDDGISKTYTFGGNDAKAPTKKPKSSSRTPHGNKNTKNKKTVKKAKRSVSNSPEQKSSVKNIKTSEKKNTIADVSEKKQSASRNRQNKLAQVKQGGEKITVRTVRALENVPFPTAIVFSSLLATVLFMAMLWNFVQINESTVALQRLERSLTSLVAEEKDLIMQLEKKNNLKTIEERAVELGMIKIDQLTKIYISVEAEEKIEIINDSGNKSFISDFIGGFKDNIRGLVEYFTQR